MIELGVIGCLRPTWVPVGPPDNARPVWITVRVQTVPDVVAKGYWSTTEEQWYWYYPNPDGDERLPEEFTVTAWCEMPEPPAPYQPVDPEQGKEINSENPDSIAY